MLIEQNVSEIFVKILKKYIEKKKRKWFSKTKAKRNISYTRKEIQGGPKVVIVLTQQYFSTHFDTKRTGVKTLLLCGPFLVLIPYIILVWKASFLFSPLCLSSYFFSRISFIFVYFHSKYKKSMILELSFYFLSLPFSSEFSLFSFLFHFFLLYVHVGQVRYSPENSNAWKIRTVPLRLGT